MQVVHFHERNSGGVVYPAHDRGVITCWQICDDRRFAWVPRSVAAVLNRQDLIASNNPADDRGLPVIIAGNQSAVAIVQFQSWIGHCICNSVLTELRTDGAYDYSL